MTIYLKWKIWVGMIEDIEKMMNKQAFLNNDDGRVVDKCVQGEWNGSSNESVDKTVIAVVWKNFTKCDSNCKSDVSCVESYMAPFFEYCCRYCKSHPWCQM